MSLMDQWDDLVSSYLDEEDAAEQFWANYYMEEKAVYEMLLDNPTEVFEGTAQELADRFRMDVVLFGGGFLDGINDSLKEKIPVDTIEADSHIKLDIDFEKLYYNMVGAKASWLYELPQWDSILSKERRRELYKTQKLSTTVIKGKKIGRNEPCPCGSGRKYKQCCGR